MDLGLAGKTALVTGGNAGIGVACARALFTEGVSVAIVARDEQRLEATAREISAQSSEGGQATVLPLRGDLSRADDVERVVATALTRLGHLDILINNAGSARSGAFLDLPDEVYLEAWTLKLLGYIRLVRAVAPHMIARRDGRIVNIVGGAARTPQPTFLAGSTTNAALINFTRGVSKELAKHNVRINAISPGMTATDRAHRLAEQRAAINGRTVEQEMAESVRGIPLGHMVDPSEVAAMAVFLVSDHLPSITGAEVLLDGGATPGI